MRVRIKEVTEAGLEVREDLPGDLLREALEDQGADLERCRGALDLRASLVGEQVLLRGQLSASVVLPCVRCLGPAEIAVESPVNLLFVPEGDEVDEDKLGDETGLGTHDGKVVVLDDLVREALILAVPMNPICTPDCKGLCPRCGQDRNSVVCGCVLEEPDPRLAVLATLKA